MERPIVTTGTFDGVHFGHQKIITRLQKIAKEKGFSVSKNSKYFISLNKIKYYSEDISDISELYSFKKELLEDLIILPIRNDDNTKKSIVNFTPLTAQNFNKNKVFPYKSTWITPRFDV